MHHRGFLLNSFQLKDEAVALIDVVAPPDHILKSPIGHSSGQVCGDFHLWVLNSISASEKLLHAFKTNYAPFYRYIKSYFKPW